jgi:hypothetical protein
MARTLEGVVAEVADDAAFVRADGGQHGELIAGA